MIDVQNVSVAYSRQGRPALDGVSFQVEKGEFAFLIGPSGSGKSTVLSALLADQRISGGTITVAGQRVDKLRGGAIARYRRTVGTVFQDYRLLERMTVEENVAFALRVIGKRDRFIKEAVPEALEMVGLSGKGRRFPAELSGGEQQRVAIARAFVNHPLVLLADEPTGNLDRRISDEIVALLQKINRTGTTVLMATHDDRIVDSMRQHVIEMRHGRVVRDEQSGVYGRM
ncbi:MAG: ATP-binding cassette domain-containing protein [Lawsonella sp.]|nr:ATP-binding cassette domain-containing protein [Mycobacteriales bacterium]